MTRVKALILDLSNVLVFHDNELLFREAGAAFGVEAGAVRGALAGLWERTNRGQLPGDELRRALCASLGREVSEARWREVWCCHFSVHQAMVDAVEGLAGRVPLVLLSNTHDLHMAHLRPLLPVLGRFDGLVLSYEEGLVKPEAAIYERALALAGVEAGRAAFFDDIERYAEAASALGIAGRVFTTAEAFARELEALGVAG